MDRTDRVVEMLAYIEAEADPARIDVFNAHAEESGDRRTGDGVACHCSQVVQSAHLERERGTDQWVLPRHDPASVVLGVRR